MKNDIWYVANVRDDLKPFESGELVYVRKAKYRESLAVGPVVILFQAKISKCLRVAESIGLFSVITLRPNNILPREAPEEENERIETAYRKFLSNNPIAKRVRKNSREDSQSTGRLKTRIQL